MSKAKLETDYQSFNMQIDKLAQDALKNIREKADAIQEEASKKGQAVELAINEKRSKVSKEKG
jgi:hypothetical protein